VADGSFDAGARSALDAWSGALAYTFQIYFDFSGYSDMAIGLGLMMAFTFPVNFDQPYRSRSITEFWRRWHISLSTWLRDYLYLPLGGNRKGPARTYVNLALVMLLGGLWHGAAWTFIAWGAYQGLWLVFERLAGKRTAYAFLPGPLQVLPTFLLIIAGWVLFRATDMAAARDYFAHMAGAGGAAALPGLVRPIHLCAFAAGALVIWLTPTTQRLIERPRAAWSLALQPLFFIALLHLHHEDHVPFLYFQF
jgi:alginate O-acetyltransferase complex protein AlgI